MVTFPPLAPSVIWWVSLIQQLASGSPEAEAILTANTRLPSSKEFGRYSLSMPNKEIITLSLAVEGGGRQLRKMEYIEGLKLSEHGDWRKNHLGAIEACLGRKPFYRDLEEPLVKAYRNMELTSLKDFNTAIYKTIFSFLMGNMESSDLSLFPGEGILRERGKEIAREFDLGISILQALATHGRETLLGILGY